MKITLKQLTESFASLGKFANDEALTIKQKYWLSRIAGAAEKEMQAQQLATISEQATAGMALAATFE